MVKYGGKSSQALNMVEMVRPLIGDRFYCIITGILPKVESEDCVRGSLDFC